MMNHHEFISEYEGHTGAGRTFTERTREDLMDLYEHWVINNSEEMTPEKARELHFAFDVGLKAGDQRCLEQVTKDIHSKFPLIGPSIIN